MEKFPLKSSERVLVPNCFKAESFFARFMGLMGKKGLPDDEAVLFPKCNSIHTFFMRFPIDVVMISKKGEVVEVVESCHPWRLLLPRRSVKHIIEMRAHRTRELGITAGLTLDYPGVWE